MKRTIGSLLFGGPGACLLALLLAACAGAGGSCRAPCTVAIAHLAVLDHHLAIPLEANGQVAEAIMDTGAAASILTEKGADALDARAVHNKDSSQAMTVPAMAQGFGGDTSGELVTVAELTLAGGRLRDAPFIELPSLRFQDSRLTGAVGGDLLQNWDLDLDVGGGVLNLDLPQQTAPVPPWQDPTTRVPLEDRSTDLIKIIVMLDGHPLKAILDTGAPRSVVSVNTAAGAEANAGDKLAAGSGVAGIRTAIRRHHFGDLSIAGLSFGPGEINVAETPNAVPDADMLLGLDVLRRTRIYVAYQAGELLIDEGSPQPGP